MNSVAALAVFGAPGRLAALECADQAGQPVRWVLTRGRNLRHTVSALAPLGQQARALCGLTVAAGEHRRLGAGDLSTAPHCETCTARSES